MNTYPVVSYLAIYLLLFLPLLCLLIILWYSFWNSSYLTMNDTNNLSPWYRTADSIGEILKGIRCYFDKALPIMLLYKKEHKQYNEAVMDNVSPSTIYGAEHLLRLFGMPLTLCCFKLCEGKENTVSQFVCAYMHACFLAFSFSPAPSSILGDLLI